jgi:hypothetical protein
LLRPDCLKPNNTLPCGLAVPARKLSRRSLSSGVGGKVSEDDMAGLKPGSSRRYNQFQNQALIFSFIFLFYGLYHLLTGFYLYRLFNLNTH